METSEKSGHEGFFQKYLKAKRDVTHLPVMVSIHLMETRSLRPAVNCSSINPFIVVSVCGQREQTIIQRNTTTCVWNTRFTFKDISLTDDQFERENIYIQVYNANTFERNDLIGQYTFSVSRVHRTKQDAFDESLFPHQVYQKWVVLTNPADPQTAEGLFSVTVLREGDNPPSHASHHLQEYATDKDYNGIRPLKAPEVKRRGYSMCINIFRAEEIPVMDYITQLSDPFIVIKFNGITVRTQRDEATLSPVWNEKIVIPVYTPCLSDNIDIQLWDWSRGNPDELIATSQVNFSQLLTDPLGPLWINFYGAPVNRTGFFGWLGEFTPDMIGDVDTECTAYLGRLLISMKATLDSNPQKYTKTIKGHVCDYYDDYFLMVDMYEGQDIPCPLGGTIMVEVCFGNVGNTRQSDWCTPGTQESVQFTCSKRSKSAYHKKGAGKSDNCQFSRAHIRMPPMNKQSPLIMQSQMPNVIINVFVKQITGQIGRVGFLRFSPFDVWTEDWVAEPEWHPIHGISDVYGNILTSPGFLLFNASFGIDPPRNRPQMIDITSSKHESYQVRAHIYQIRGLPAAADEGLANPFVTVSLQAKMGVLWEPDSTEVENSIGHPRIPEQKSTDIAKLSLNPIFYQTLCIEKVRCPLLIHNSGSVSNLKGITRNIIINVWHSSKDVNVSDEKSIKKQRLLGTAYFAPWRCITKYWESGGEWNEPKWLKLQPPKGDGRIDAGFILVKISIIGIEKMVRMTPLIQSIIRQPFPQLQRCFLRVALFRIFNIKKGFFGVAENLSKCAIEINVPKPPMHLVDKKHYTNEIDGMVLDDVENAKYGSKLLVCNEKYYEPYLVPTFLQTVTLDVMIPPNNPDQAPSMTVILYDCASSSNRTLLASLCVPLGPYISGVYADDGIISFECKEAQIPSFMSNPVQNLNMSSISSITNEQVMDILSTGENCKDYFVLDVDTLNTFEEKEISVKDVERIRRQAIQDKKLLADSKNKESEIVTETQLWPTEKHEDQEGSLGSGIVIRHAWESDKNHLPVHWFETFNLRFGMLQRYNNVNSRWFDSRSSWVWKNEVLAKLKMSIFCHTVKPTVSKSVEDKIKDWDTNMIASPHGAIFTMSRKCIRVQVRIYVKCCHDLIPSTAGGTLNPYLNMKISGDKSRIPLTGNEIFEVNNMTEAQVGTLSPQFFCVHCVDAEMPNRSMLTIQVLNNNSIASSLIGETVVDLTDRWYNPKWRALLDAGRIPTEFRTLHYPGLGIAQGNIELRIEMFPSNVAYQHEFLPISLKRPIPWELRVVVWDCQSISPTKSPDLFFTVEFQDENSNKADKFFPTKQIQESNVSYSSKDGGGEFNYRFKFPVMVPSQAPRLKVKAWSHSLIGTNTYISEANIDLKILFATAAKTGERQDRERAYINMWNPSKQSSGGKVGMQLSLVTQRFAETFPVGYARSAPNRDPYLQPLSALQKSFSQIFFNLFKYTVAAVILILIFRRIMD